MFGKNHRICVQHTSWVSDIIKEKVFSCCVISQVRNRSSDSDRTSWCRALLIRPVTGQTASQLFDRSDCGLGVCATPGGPMSPIQRSGLTCRQKRPPAKLFKVASEFYFLRCDVV
jgi:hypothetical protein